MTLFVREAGTGGGETIVLLHGFGGTGSVWAGVEAELGRFGLLVHDLPGHGASHAYPDAGPAKTAAVAILADLAARGVERAHVVGHSMGGAIASLMAILDGERIASLTLLAPGGYGPEINHRLLRRWAAAADEQTVRSCLEAMFGWNSPVSDDVVATVMEDRSMPGRVHTLVRIADGLARDGRQGQLPLDRLGLLDIPVSVAWGMLDNVLPARQIRNLPAGFAVHRFADLGHMLPEEAPAGIAAIVRRTVAASAQRDNGG